MLAVLLKSTQKAVKTVGSKQDRERERVRIRKRSVYEWAISTP